MSSEGYFLDLLELDAEKDAVIAVVGGGGKTSLICRLTEEFLEKKKKVIISTTTHMFYEPKQPFALDGNREKVKEMLERYGYVIAAGIEKKTGKLCSLKQGVLEALRPLCNIMLIEADGSRQKPIKVPEKWEPVIPEIADIVISVVGLDCLGKPICQTGHRVELIAEFLEKNIESPITKDDIVKIAASIYGLFKNVNNREYRVYLNKADVLQNADVAKEIVGKLEEEGKTAAFGSLLKEKEK